MPKAMPSATTLLLVGGGLANGLIALRLAESRPDFHVQILERDDRLGGEHTWSFFETDLEPASAAWIATLVRHSWPDYEVRFPKRVRRLPVGYRSVSSGALALAVHRAFPHGVRLNTAVEDVSPGRITLAGGEVLPADVVIDGRGPGPLPHLALGYQKFVGLEVELATDHGCPSPMIMDATVPQEGGYRFLYVLPFGPRRVLIEDTRYTDGAELDETDFEAGVRAYAAHRGWEIARVIRRERGVLPVALDGAIAEHWRAAGGRALSGLSAALFHPTTGYSLPNAVRLAERLAALRPFTAETVANATREASIENWRAGAFYRRLNRMLFRAAAPEDRYKVLQRFYGLGDSLIARFYAGKTTTADQLRILAGRPPVPISAALAAWAEKGRA